MNVGEIRNALPSDAAGIAAIYNHYIAETSVSFEETPVSTEAMRDRIADVCSLGLPWLVLETSDELTGYAYANQWKIRSAYRYSVETTIYLSPAHTGRGGGTVLYRALLASVKTAGIHRAIGGIALPNTASVALHEKLGFKKVAHFGEVGWKRGRWIDVAYWELAL